MTLPRPIICLVTDRQRTGTEDDQVRLAGVAAEAGVTLVHVRERDLDDRQLYDLTTRIVDAVRTTPAKVVVNDRVDVALGAGAHGVHLRADSFPAARVRRIVPGPFIIGRAVHSAAEAADAGDVDYVVMGTVFPTRSKRQGTALAGLAGLEAACRVSPVPVLAIGGVAADNLANVAAAGAAGIAAIGLFSDTYSHTSQAKRDAALCDVVARIRGAFG